MIISDDFLSQLHNSKPDFQSPKSSDWKTLIPGFPDWKCSVDPGIRNLGIAISTYISIKKMQFHLPTLRLLLLTPTLHATQFQLLNVSGWSIKNAQLLTTTPV